MLAPTLSAGLSVRSFKGDRLLLGYSTLQCSIIRSIVAL